MTVKQIRSLLKRAGYPQNPDWYTTSAGEDLCRDAGAVATILMDALGEAERRAEDAEGRLTTLSLDHIGVGACLQAIARSMQLIPEEHRIGQEQRDLLNRMMDYFIQQGNALRDGTIVPIIKRIDEAEREAERLRAALRKAEDTFRVIMNVTDNEDRPDIHKTATYGVNRVLEALAATPAPSPVKEADG